MGKFNIALVERTRDDLIRYLKLQDAFWSWKGHKHVAQLASGKLSDFFANLSPLYTNLRLQEQVGWALVYNAFQEADYQPLKDENLWVIGPAMGTVGLVQSVVNAIKFHNVNVKCAYTEKEYEAFNSMEGWVAIPKDTMVLKRFHLGDSPAVLLVEDVTTTGGTIMRTREAIKREYPEATFCTSILSVIDRRSPEDEGIFLVKSLLRVKPKTWETVDDLPEAMKGCIPLRPKANWKKLAEEML